MYSQYNYMYLNSYLPAGSFYRTEIWLLFRSASLIVVLLINQSGFQPKFDLFHFFKKEYHRKEHLNRSRVVQISLHNSFQ